LAIAYRGWIPIPAWSTHFWNTNLLDAWPGVQALLGAALLVGAALLLRRRPLALGLLVVGALGLMVFELRFKGFARHHGHLFLLLTCACWIAKATPSRRPDARANQRDRSYAAILGLNAVAGLGSMVAGLVLPFSASWATAEFIKTKVEEPVAIMAMEDYCASPIAQWLDREIYYPNMRTFARWNTQNPAARHPVDVNTLLSTVVGLARASGSDVLFLLSYIPGRALQLPELVPLPERRQGLRVRPLASFLDGVVADEGQLIYRFSLVDLPAQGLPASPASSRD
jgi:hypothetical protein